MIMVESLGEEYRVTFEVSEDVEYDINGNPTLTCNDLHLHWGMHREWLDEWMCLPDLPRGSKYNDDDPCKPATRTPLVRDGEGCSIVFRNGFPLRMSRTKFDVPAYFAPVEIDFALVEIEFGTDRVLAYDGPKGPDQWPSASFAVPIGMEKGHPEPLGASRAAPISNGPGYVNFALHSGCADKVTLFLQWCTGDGATPNTMEIALNPTVHRTGDVWHVALPVGIPGSILPLPASSASWEGGADPRINCPTVLYGYKCDGDPARGGWRFHPGMVMFDPRATCLLTPLGAFQDPFTRLPKFLGSLADVMNGGTQYQLAYDPGPNEKAVAGVRKLRQIPAQEIIYELSVADFTNHISADLGNVERGTYAGVLAKVDHIIQSGATTVLLQPIAASARRAIDDNWGAAPVSLFAPDPEMTTPHGGDGSYQVRQLVRGLQARGLDVLVHVVLTHLGEGTDASPESHSIRGIDAFSYYEMNSMGKVKSNPSVPGTAVLNLRSHVTRELIIDSLRHWRTGFGVDGFLVDTTEGITNLTGIAALLEAIALDAVLSGKTDSGGVSAAVEVARGNSTNKFLAGGGVRLYITPNDREVGQIQTWGILGERNSLFLRDISKFMEGSNGALRDFASRVCGSADLIKDCRSSSFGHVINSLTLSPHGKTLADTASDLAARAKVETTTGISHPRGLGEDVLGPSDFMKSRAPLRAMPPVPPTAVETNLMMRSLLTILFSADGIPLISAGDEYGHTRLGEGSAPNSWKSEINSFRWDALKCGTAGHAVHSFISALSAFRRRRADLFSSGGANVHWTVMDGYTSPKWDEYTAPCLLMCHRKAHSPHDRTGIKAADTTVPSQDAIIVFNGTRDLQSAEIGHPPDEFAWVRVVDTSLAFPSDCTLSYVELAGTKGSYLVSPHAVAIFELAPAPEGYLNPKDSQFVR